eukprot:TRINITY_DN95024_c0_g1_i1.p1 TRINITY_DN95024_c0_g1~~TRINITY_DN95024_c0_g1_i1.p1  ORF type:complete len:483 (+),score=33.45 TRINITY_DN95024_c0_g1_i1:53-1450(+)
MARRDTHPCMSCHFLGDTIFGQDVDSVFAYETPKIVRIQDRTLGILRLLLMLAVFIYIVVYNLWYKGQHFIMSKIHGVVRMQWQEPTSKGCSPMHTECIANFTTTAELPYCEDYAGSEPELSQRHCEYYDAEELPIRLGQGVLLPTRILVYNQERTCPKAAAACPRKYSFADSSGKVQAQPGRAAPVSDHFVANADDFTVLVDHSFRTSGGEVAYDDFTMLGTWKVCRDESPRVAQNSLEAMRMLLQDEKKLTCEVKPMLCLHDNCERKSATEDMQASIKAFSLQDGDVFSIKTLLAMAGASLEDKADPTSNASSTVRERGTAIVMRIEYSNMHPWQLWQSDAPPRYTVTVSQRPVTTFKDSDVLSHDDKGRIMRRNYGVYLVIEQTGSIGIFSRINMLITIAAGMALLAASSKITDFLAMYLLRRRDDYWGVKYEVSEDYVTVNWNDKSLSDSETLSGSGGDSR